MKIILMVVIAIFSMSCAKMYTSETTASYVKNPDGTFALNYTSNKEQQGLTASVDPDTGKLDVHVDKSGTAEVVVQAVSAMQQKMLDMMNKMMDQLIKAGGVAAPVATVP